MFELVTMRRKKRACSDPKQVLAAFSEACELTLALKDEPYPYAVTVNYAPLVQEDELYLLFHGAKAGRKYDLICHDPRCAFTITLRSQVELNARPQYSTNFFKSLSGEGTIKLLEGQAAFDACVQLMMHHGYHGDLTQLNEQIQSSLPVTQMFALHVERAGLKEHSPAH